MFDYSIPENLLSGKNILVTGASEGIGRAAALKYASLGAHVILLARDQERLNSLYDEISDKGYPQAAIVPFDLNQTEPDSYQQLCDVLEDEFQQLDGLLHNAGILGQKAPLESYQAETFNKVMQINVTAQFLLTKALLPLLKQSPDASIIFTSSSVGRKGRAFWGAYAISKFATEGMMQTFAEELYDISRIRCNSINPGATRTAMRATAYPAENPNTVKAAEEILPLYCYLMGNDSKTENGKAFNAQ